MVISAKFDPVITQIGDVLHQELVKAGEERIEVMLSDLRKQLRARLGEMVMGFLEHNYSAVRSGSELVITVNLKDPKESQK